MTKWITSGHYAQCTKCYQLRDARFKVPYTCPKCGG